MNTALTASLRLSLSSCRVARRTAAGPVRAMVSSLCGSAERLHCSSSRAARSSLETPPPSRCRLPPPVQAAAAGGDNTYHVLQYKYVPDLLEKRGPFREHHLAGANTMVRPGEAAPLALTCPTQAVRPPPLLLLTCTINSWVLQAEQNKLVMAGALTDPVDGAIFIFR